jgi:hypothetical protein
VEFEMTDNEIRYKQANDTGNLLAAKNIIITEQADTIKELSASLELAIRYLEHPDVQAMPFALHPSAVVKRAKAILSKAQS